MKNLKLSLLSNIQGNMNWLLICLNGKEVIKC